MQNTEYRAKGILLALFFIATFVGMEGASAQDAPSQPAPAEPKSAHSDSATDAKPKSEEADTEPLPEVLPEGPEGEGSASDLEEEADVAKKAPQAAQGASDLGGLDPIAIIARAEAVERDLAEYEERLRVPEAVSQVREELRSQEEELEQVVERASRQLAGAGGAFMLLDVRFELSQRLEALQVDVAPVIEFQEVLADVGVQLEALRTDWEKTRNNLREVGAPGEVTARAQRLLHRIRQVGSKVRRARTAVLTVGTRAARMRSSIEKVLEQSRTEGPSLLSDFGHRGKLPFETAIPSLSQLLEASSRALRHSYRNAVRFIEKAPASILVQLFLFTALVAFVRRRRKAEVPPNRGEADSRPSVVNEELIYRHPIASSTLATLFAGLLLHSPRPSGVALVLLIIAMSASGFVLLDRRTREGILFVVGAFTLTSLLAAHLAVVSLPEARIWLLGIEGVAVLLFASRMMTFPGEGWNGWWRQFLVLVSKAWLIASVLGLVLWALGFDWASGILIGATSRLMLVTVAYRVAYDVLGGFARVMSRTSLANRLLIVRRDSELLVERFLWVLRLLFLLAWVQQALRGYTLAAPLGELVSEVVEKKLEVGSLSITVGDILALSVGILLAVYASRLTRYLLDEEVLPRTKFSVGSRATVTASARYVVLGVGLFMALAAVGFELDKLTILVSALGVGIGFGLQNIVQNFVAGIILIFEQPIKVSDRVEVGGLLGTVTKVGFRASTVKTFQGAEVIVPNSQFVADQVINWSLSDDLRRVEVEVGVKYGTDPQTVLDILLQAAKGHEKILDWPEPDSIFVAFGESSLDFQLRAWTAEGGAWLNIRSDISVEVNRLLAEAGIEIPFPQRDLHVRSIESAVDVKVGTPQKS